MSVWYTGIVKNRKARLSNRLLHVVSPCLFFFFFWLKSVSGRLLRSGLITQSISYNFHPPIFTAVLQGSDTHVGLISESETICDA